VHHAVSWWQQGFLVVICNTLHSFAKCLFLFMITVVIDLLNVSMCSLWSIATQNCVKRDELYWCHLLRRGYVAIRSGFVLLAIKLWLICKIVTNIDDPVSSFILGQVSLCHLGGFILQCGSFSHSKENLSCYWVLGSVTCEPGHTAPNQAITHPSLNK